MEWLDAGLYGILGGFFAELLGWFKLRQESPENFPIWIKSPFYWIITFAMMLAGGSLVIIYNQSGFALDALVAVNIGASAPLILGSLVAQAPQAGKVD